MKRIYQGLVAYHINGDHVPKKWKEYFDGPPPTTRTAQWLDGESGENMIIHLGRPMASSGLAQVDVTS